MGGDPLLGEEAVCQGREVAIHHGWEKAMCCGMNWTSCGVVGRKNLGFSHST